MTRIRIDWISQMQSSESNEMSSCDKNQSQMTASSWNWTLLMFERRPRRHPSPLNTGETCHLFVAPRSSLVIYRYIVVGGR